MTLTTPSTKASVSVTSVPHAVQTPPATDCSADMVVASFPCSTRRGIPRLVRHNCEHFTSFGLREPAMESTHLGLRENLHSGNPSVLSEPIDCTIRGDVSVSIRDDATGPNDVSHHSPGRGSTRLAQRFVPGACRR